MDHFDDIGPSVVMASPGMIQNGLSRELFESWCTDKRNGVIIAGYCVEGTLAKVSTILGWEPMSHGECWRSSCSGSAFGLGGYLHRLYQLFPQTFLLKITRFLR
jgi:Cft2 family RNA processing exonuclease